MFLSLLMLTISATAHADETTVTVHLVNDKGVGKTVGSVRMADSQYGLVLYPDLSGLPPGPHGFHVHQNPDCGPGEGDGKMVPALAAGGHFDPTRSGQHEGPYGSGHLGDLPVLWVGGDGKAGTPILAPRPKVANLEGHSLMIHAGGDNYSDNPKSLGGGGARLACGVFVSK